MRIKAIEDHEKKTSEEIMMALKYSNLIPWIKIFFTVMLFVCRIEKKNPKTNSIDDSVNSNSLAFDTESFYHKNISIVCIRHIPGKSFLFSNYVICSLDVETPYATHSLQLFALADLGYERQL